jgi:Mrp family chromosome partitioning ATPase
MGRMFRIITEGPESQNPASDRSGTALLEPPVDDVPFVEVGGPTGLVTSIPKGIVTPIPQPPPVPVSMPIPQPMSVPQPVSVPMKPAPVHEAPLNAGRVLSVTFHRLPQAGLRLMATGVSADVIAYHQPDHPVSAEYRIVRDEIRKQFEEPGSRIALFASASAASGTTTVLVNLATTLSQLPNSRVLLIDSHYDRPAIAARLGVPDSPGLSDVLGQKVPLPWALQPTPVSNLQVLTCGIPTDHTAECLGDELPKLLIQLRNWFDWVLVDAGVWLDFLGSETVGPSADAVYLVSRSNDIERAEFTSLRPTIAAAGGHLRGYITTR